MDEQRQAEFAADIRRIESDIFELADVDLLHVKYLAGSYLVATARRDYDPPASVSITFSWHDSAESVADQIKAAFND